MVRGDERLEHNHPAGVGGPLEQRVGQLGNVHVHLVGAVDQIWDTRQVVQRVRSLGQEILSTLIDSYRLGSTDATRDHPKQFIKGQSLVDWSVLGLVDRLKSFFPASVVLTSMGSPPS